MALRGKMQTPELLRKALTLLSIVAPIRPLIGPNSISMEVSTRCNYSCLMCPFHSPLAEKDNPETTDFMDVAVAARIFEGAAKLGVQILHIGGTGEPTMHPDLAGIVRLARSLGIQSRVFTNGSLLTHRLMEQIIDAGLARLTVSLVGASAESYVAMHPHTTPASFQRILDSIATLQRMKKEAGSVLPRLELRFIALRHSYLELEKMVELGIQLGAENIQLVPLMYHSAVDVDACALGQDEERLAVNRLRELAPTAARAGLKTNLDEMAVYHLFGSESATFPCYAGWVEINVLVDGTVRFCMRCDRIVGNVNERPLEEIWRDPEYQSLRRLARATTDRPKIGECDCNCCCLFYTNWLIDRRLSTLGLAPKIRSKGIDYDLTGAAGHAARPPNGELSGQTSENNRETGLTSVGRAEMGGDRLP